ncbi:MAG: toll/interleukin-1 receptor domain-containing protein [Myxococcota bacterium]
MAQSSLQVFISYARDDASPFAEDLLAGLEAAGFDPFLDRHDIAGGEPWVERLAALLQRADTMVFVLTPAALTSQHCSWELERAHALSKRVIPVVAADVAQDQVPATLRRLNYVSFVQQRFGVALRELTNALRVDVDWVREHTRLGELASRWDARERSEALLLRGEELEATKGWFAGWKGGEPAPTELQQAFLNASEAAQQAQFSEERRRLAEVAAAQDERARALSRATRANRISLGVVIVLFIVTSGGLYQLVRAQEQVEQLQEQFAQLSDQIEGRKQDIEFLDAEQRDRQTLARDFDKKLEQVSRPEPDAAYTGLPWSIDVFWCEGSPNEPLADRLVARLGVERDRQFIAGPGPAGLPFPIDRVRSRKLSIRTNARPGYDVHTNEVRPERDEADQGRALAAFLEVNGGPPLREKISSTPTPYYLSVFLCEGTKRKPRGIRPE